MEEAGHVWRKSERARRRCHRRSSEPLELQRTYVVGESEASTRSNNTKKIIEKGRDRRVHGQAWCDAHGGQRRQRCFGRARRWMIYPMINCSGKLWTLGTSECKELEGGSSCMMNFGEEGGRPW